MDVNLSGLFIYIREAAGCFASALQRLRIGSGADAPKSGVPDGNVAKLTDGERFAVGRHGIAAMAVTRCVLL